MIDESIEQAAEGSKGEEHVLEVRLTEDGNV